MKNINLKLIAIIFIFTFSECKKKDNTPAPTVFTVHCIDNLGNPVVGASVQLFNNSTDLLSKTNIAFSGTSDASGNATFSNVNTQIYYFLCQTSNCLINQGADYITTPLVANTTTTINAIMTGYGSLTVTNTSTGANPYEIKLNGVIWSSNLAYGQSITTYLPLGTCTVEAIQLSGYLFTPTDVTYAPTITQCNNVQQNIP